MKKLLCLILLISMSVTVFSAFSVTADAAMAPKDAMDGYENLVLAYTHNSNRADYGRFSPDDFKPYVLYLDKNGKAQDYFFDSYLFLPCMSYGPSSARMHYDKANPTKAIDWTFYVEDTFYKDTNVDALEVAFGNAKNEMNDTSDRKAGVVLSILYPGVEAGNKFGSLGGKELDFTKTEDRKYAIRWIIDEQLKLFNEREYKNLDLIGFYWLEEYVTSGAQGNADRELFKYTSEYLHSKGLKFVWIPWFRSTGYSAWKSLGFDVVTMQPNMFWQTEVDPKRVENCLNDCKRFGMGLEIEVDGKALSSGEYYNRYLDYLDGGRRLGAMDSVKMYYQDANKGVYYNACYSKDARARSVYDLTYKYAKGTLTEEDIKSQRSETFKLDEDVKWISKNRPYTATPPYSDGSAIEYQNNDGKELTDGVIGVSELGTEWHAYHKSNLDRDGRMSVTIDLGKVRNDLTHFMIHFSHIENHGIGDPADDVQIYISDNGKDFKLLATPKLQYVDIISYVKFVCQPVSARYVKFSFINSDSNFVFCSEALVGVGDPSKITDAPVVSFPESVPESDIDSTVESTPESTPSASEDSEAVSNVETVENEGGNTVLYVVIGLCAVIVIVAVIIVLKKKKNSK